MAQRAGVGDRGGDGEAAAPGADVLDAFVEHIRYQRGLSGNTVRAYATDVGSLIEHAVRMGRDIPSGLDIEVLRSWLAKLATTGRARTTLARRASVVRAFPVVASLASQLRSTSTSSPAGMSRPIRTACSTRLRTSVAYARTVLPDRPRS
jgi:integrase/recombinase XerC